MANQYLDICDHKESEYMDNFGLPFEIWSKIFGYIDFKTQNLATLVRKSWLKMIRNDFKFSGELSLNSINKMEASEINSIISKWNKLKVLRALNTWHPQKSPYWSHNGFCFPTVELKILEIEFHLCPTLERVVVPVVANTTINGQGVTFYFDKHAVYDLGRMLPSWARVSKIWFNPQIKELQKLGLENVSELCLEFDKKTQFVESFRTSENEGVPPIFDNPGISTFLHKIPPTFVCTPNLSDLSLVLSLETIGASMKNLDSLCIWIKDPRHNIDYCLPLLQNLPNNLHLQIAVEGDGIQIEHFPFFIKNFALKVSSLNVDIDIYIDEFVTGDPCWIRHFKNLEKLDLDSLNYGFDYHVMDHAIKELFQNPLFKLKEFRNPKKFFKTDKFLMRIFEAFPMIETLIINHADWHDEGNWILENLLSVLQTLLSIKNLAFSDHITLMESDFSLVETKVIFEAAFDLIKQFPNDSDIKINETVYGYKIIKEKGMLPRIYHKKCISDPECTIPWLYHTVCRICPTQKEKSINTIIDFFINYETRMQSRVVHNMNMEITLIKLKDISVEETANIFALLFDIIKKFPTEICLKVVENVYGYKIIKEEMKEPRIYHRVCEKDCTKKFSYHTICTKPTKTDLLKDTIDFVESIEFSY